MPINPTPQPRPLRSIINTILGRDPALDDTPLVMPPRLTMQPPRVGMPPPRVGIPPTPAVDHDVPNIITPDTDDPVVHRPSRLRPSPNPRFIATLRGNYVAAAASIAATEALANAVIDKDTGLALEYRALSTGPDKETWVRALANDIGRLAQGVGGRVKGNNTIFFVHPSKIPKDRKVTYGRLVSSIHPNKAEVNRVRLTVGGDRLPYVGSTTTRMASLTTTKCLFNSVLSTKGARFMDIDIKDFYYDTPLEKFEYMQLPLKLIPQEIVEKYKLVDLAVNGNVFVEIRKGMPGLKQAGKIANDRLTTHLAKHGYRPVPRTPSLWKHDTNSITFTLVVDDFGVKYTDKGDADHLLHALKKQYDITFDWEGKKYLGVDLDWDYKNRTVTLSMQDYVRAALHKLRHLPPKRKQRAPHRWNTPSYGAKIQYAQVDDDPTPLGPNELTRVQQIVGTFLYYAMALDNTMLVALGSIASQQSVATATTMSAANMLLDYAASNPIAKIRYHASDMQLHTHSDASYLSEPKARSREAGFFFLSDRLSDPKSPPPPHHP